MTVSKIEKSRFVAEHPCSTSLSLLLSSFTFHGSHLVVGPLRIWIRVAPRNNFGNRNGSLCLSCRPPLTSRERKKEKRPGSFSEAPQRLSSLPFPRTSHRRTALKVLSPSERTLGGRNRSSASRKDRDRDRLEPHSQLHDDRSHTPALEHLFLACLLSLTLNIVPLNL